MFVHTTVQYITCIIQYYTANRPPTYIGIFYSDRNMDPLTLDGIGNWHNVDVGVCMYYTVHRKQEVS